MRASCGRGSVRMSTDSLTPRNRTDSCGLQRRIARRKALQSGKIYAARDSGVRQIDSRTLFNLNLRRKVCKTGHTSEQFNINSIVFSVCYRSWAVGVRGSTIKRRQTVVLMAQYEARHPRRLTRTRQESTLGGHGNAQWWRWQFPQTFDG